LLATNSDDAQRDGARALELAKQGQDRWFLCICSRYWQPASNRSPSSSRPG
jgi:hypothetical protein